MWWRGWTHEGRRGENTCGGEGGHMRGEGVHVITMGGGEDKFLE